MVEMVLVAMLEGVPPPPAPTVGVVAVMGLPVPPAAEGLLAAVLDPLGLPLPLPVPVAHAESVGVVDTVGVPVNWALAVLKALLVGLAVALSSALRLADAVSVPPYPSLPVPLALTEGDRDAPPTSEGLPDWLCTLVAALEAVEQGEADWVVVLLEVVSEVDEWLPPPPHPPTGVLVGVWEGLEG